MSASALARWRELLPQWGIPQQILDQAEDDPWGYPVQMFAGKTELMRETATPSLMRAAEALPPGGSVIDVGCGAGAGSLPLVPPAASVVGVDADEGMLAEFARLAGAFGAAHREVAGRWPDAAEDAGLADVVVCHHVLYNVADLEPFVIALTAAARRRVVIELTSSHPRAWQRDLWRRFWNIERPSGPDAADAIAALAEMGLVPASERFPEPQRGPHHDPGVFADWVRRSLCLPASRLAGVAEALEREPVPERELVAIWWDGSA